MDDKKPTHKENYEYGIQAMQWYGWGSPVGLGLGVALLLTSIGAMLWLMHLADIL